MFIDERNYDIGREVVGIPIPEPIEIKTLGSGKSEYLYEYKDTDCKWAFVIDDETQIVESWHYISEPELCYHYIDWLGPW
jgi:hypothetical protein